MDVIAFDIFVVSLFCFSVCTIFIYSYEPPDNPEIIRLYEFWIKKNWVRKFPKLLGFIGVISLIPAIYLVISNFGYNSLWIIPLTIWALYANLLQIKPACLMWSLSLISALLSAATLFN